MRRGCGARSVGMNASQLSMTRTVWMRRAAIGGEVARAPSSAWNSCHRYGPTAAGQ